jgi:hypothetical protein
MILRGTLEIYLVSNTVSFQVNVISCSYSTLSVNPIPNANYDIWAGTS